MNYGPRWGSGGVANSHYYGGIPTPRPPYRMTHPKPLKPGSAEAIFRAMKVSLALKAKRKAPPPPQDQAADLVMAGLVNKTVAALEFGLTELNETHAASTLINRKRIVDAIDILKKAVRGV